MKKKHLYIYLIFALFITFINIHKNIKSVTIGSDTDVNLFTTQQTLNDGDRIATFAFLEAGFEINSMATTATFDSTFPVTGEVKMNMGTLDLSQDLMFDNNSNWYSIGNINGNDLKIKIPPSMQEIPSAGQATQDVYLITNQIEADDVVTLDWSYDNQFIAIGLNDATASHVVLKIYSFDGINTTLVYSWPLGYYKEILSVRWHPTKHILAIGRRSTTNELITFEFDPVLHTLTQKGAVNFSTGVFSVEWHPTGNLLAVGPNDTSSQIYLYHVDNSGVINPTPVDTVVTGRPGFETMDWDSTGQYLLYGTKQIPLELNVYELNLTTSTLSENASESFSNEIGAVSWNKTFTQYIAVGLTGTTERMRIYEHDGNAGTLTQVASDNGSISVKALDWGADGNVIYVGRESSGSLPEFSGYVFNNSDNSLTNIASFNFANEVEAVRSSSDNNYIAVGTDTWDFNVYTAYKQGATVGAVTFDNTNLFLNTNLLLKNSEITFSGNCSIIGNDKELTLDGASKFIIDSNSTLILENITVNGVSDDKLDGTDSTSTLELNNVKWTLDNNYEFTAGALNIIREFEVFGPEKTFTYKSTTTSFINENSTLILNNNLTFNYDPDINNYQLIELTDPTSAIHLNGATIYGSYGLRLTKGILKLSRNSTLSTEGTTDTLSIYFGDNSSSANNLTVILEPGSTVNVGTGRVRDHNIY